MNLTKKLWIFLFLLKTLERIPKKRTLKNTTKFIININFLNKSLEKKIFSKIIEFLLKILQTLTIRLIKKLLKPKKQYYLIKILLEIIIIKTNLKKRNKFLIIIKMKTLNMPKLSNITLRGWKKQTKEINFLNKKI